VRYARRVDANHDAVREAYLADGAAVTDLSGVGAGLPDLLVEYPDLVFLAEVKDGTKPPSARELTPAQKRMHAVLERLGVKVRVVTSASEAHR
jgi:hypothetical protein